MDKINEFRRKFQSSKIYKFQEKYLAKPIHFIMTVVSWTIFIILLLCALFLVYYYTTLTQSKESGENHNPKFALYTIISGSMEPAIKVYDVIFVVGPDNQEDVKVGDVISYNSSNFKQGEMISVTHRVIEIVVDKEGNYNYYTKGDNTFVKDPDPVVFDDISGVLMFKIPQLGKVQFFLASKIGWVCAIIIPALFIIIKYLVELLNLPMHMARLDKNGKFLPLYTKRVLLPYKSKGLDGDTKEDEIIDLTNVNKKKSSEETED